MASLHCKDFLETSKILHDGISRGQINQYKKTCLARLLRVAKTTTTKTQKKQQYWKRTGKKTKKKANSKWEACVLSSHALTQTSAHVVRGIHKSRWKGYFSSLFIVNSSGVSQLAQRKTPYFLPFFFIAHKNKMIPPRDSIKIRYCLAPQAVLDV